MMKKGAFSLQGIMSLTSMIVILLSLYIFNISFAETIILKSGEKIKGKIIERATDYIKIDFYGVPLPYYFEDIESIDGQPPNQREGKQKSEVKAKKAAPKDQGDKEEGLIDWEKWHKYSNINTYMSKLKKFEDKSQQIAIQLNREIKESIDQALRKNVITNASYNLSILIKELQALEPPRPLRTYHQKIIGVYISRKLAIDATLVEDRHSQLRYNKKELMLGIEAVKELRRVYIKNDAPRETINELDREIARLRQLLK